MTQQHLLSGLDGQNPLGFLAALGLLRVLDDEAVARGATRPRLAYVPEGTFVPTLSTDLALDEIVEHVLKDACEQKSNRALQFAYNESAEIVNGDAPDAVRDLKPPPSLAQQLLEDCSIAPRRTSDLAAAFFSELVKDNKGNAKPTALHFTAGQQTYLGAVEVLRQRVTGEDVREALIGPWLTASTLPSLSWDSVGVRNYALRASNPSFEKKGCEAGANWLASVGMCFFPVVVNAAKLGTPSSEKLLTTAIRGGWKDSVFRWPLWSGALTSRVVAGLIRSDLRALTAEQRQALGISQVYGSNISRSDQGGYGSFSPANVELPAKPKPVGART